MKRKLSSILLAAALMVSLSAPAFAANCQTPVVRSACLNDALSQIILQYGCGASNGGGQTTQLDLNALLNQLLKQYGVAVPATPQETPAEQEQPAETETPAPPEKPAEPEEPAQPEKPAEPEQPTQPETPAQPEQPAQQEPIGVSAYEREVIRLVNAERAKYGLAALTEDAALTRTARMKSQDMHDRGYFDHNSPTYGTPFQLMKSQGISYRTAGENIAMGYRTPEAVVNAWMNSAGHRANILNASYTKIGVGYVESGNYWTQHFTG